MHDLRRCLHSAKKQITPTGLFSRSTREFRTQCAIRPGSLRIQLQTCSNGSNILQALYRTRSAVRRKRIRFVGATSRIQQSSPQILSRATGQGSRQRQIRGAKTSSYPPHHLGRHYDDDARVLPRGEEISPSANSLTPLEQFIQRTETAGNRPREAIFSALRIHLLRFNTPAKPLVDLLRRHFLLSSAFTGPDLNKSERGILIEILRKVLHEWSQWRDIQYEQFVSPTRLILFYARYELLEPQDWAFCLNSLAWTAYEGFLSELEVGVDQRLQRTSDTFLLVRQLLRTWRLFFHYHSEGAELDLYEVLNSSEDGLWPVLNVSRLPTILDSLDADYSQRLLGFAPRWKTAGKSPADTQLACASVVSTAAMAQFVQILTACDVLHPSSNIDWEGSTISSRDETGNRGRINSQEEVYRTETVPAGQPVMSISKLHRDELSMFFIVGQAVDSATINLTLLSLALRKFIPATQATQMVTFFTQFKKRASSLLSRIGPEPPNPDLRHEMTAGFERYEGSSLVRRQQSPTDPLLQQILAAETIVEVALHEQTYLALRKRNPRLRSTELHRALIEKIWELDSREREQWAWNAFPDLHTIRELWTERLNFYLKRNDEAGFENVWAQLNAMVLSHSEADWCMRLQLLFNCGNWSMALDRFDAFTRLSGCGSRHASYENAQPPSAAMLNLMIRNLLNFRLIDTARSIISLVAKQERSAAYQTTYDLFVSYFMNARQFDEAMYFAKRRFGGIRTMGIDKFFPLIKDQLQHWPYSAPWADVHLILESVFGRTLGMKYELLGIRNLVLEPQDSRWSVQVKPSSSEDTLEKATVVGNADVLTEKISVRGVDFPEDTVKHLQNDYLTLMSAIATEFTEPKSVRLLLILWTHCLLQGITPTQEMESFLSDFIFKLPFRQQLKVLAGDSYKNPETGQYQNFSYVRDHFGSAFMARHLDGLGLADVATQIRTMKWYGFGSWTIHHLSKTCNRRACLLVRHELKDLSQDLDGIRKEDRSTTKPWIRTPEGLWNLSRAEVDSTGVLRKVPFAYWEPEPKRSSTSRFKLATSAVKLLAGEKGVEELKSQMITTRREGINADWKNLAFQMLRDFGKSRDFYYPIVGTLPLGKIRKHSSRDPFTYNSALRISKRLGEAEAIRGADDIPLQPSRPFPKRTHASESAEGGKDLPENRVKDAKNSPKVAHRAEQKSVREERTAGEADSTSKRRPQPKIPRVNRRTNNSKPKPSDETTSARPKSGSQGEAVRGIRFI